MDNLQLELERLKKALEEEKNKKLCPECQRCPTCGRRNDREWPRVTWEGQRTPSSDFDPPFTVYMMR